MILFKHFVQESKLHGQGLFAGEYIKKGSLTMILDSDKWLSEQQYLFKCETETEGSKPTTKHTACKIVGDVWIDIDREYLKPEDRINHSFDPNLLYHLGICFARRNLVQGEELTIDYQHILSNDEKDWILDSFTNREVIGYPFKESFRISAKEYNEFVQDLFKEDVVAPTQPKVRDHIKIMTSSDIFNS